MLQGERVEEARELGVGAELHLEDLHGRERVGPVDVRARHVEAAGLRGGREAVEARFAVEHGLEPPVLVREQRRRAAGQQLLERVEEGFVRVGVVRDVAAQDDVDAARRGLEEVAPPVLVHRDVAGAPPVHQSVAPRELDVRSVGHLDVRRAGGRREDADGARAAAQLQHVLARDGGVALDVGAEAARRGPDAVADARARHGQLQVAAAGQLRDDAARREGRRRAREAAEGRCRHGKEYKREHHDFVCA
mmetsp:Transcript_30233/g.102761  ORF Transcript_30233/g.102761 Transcript_30233/m.102761 type:complete len:249 (-) Transcript_30233:159-905(-)